MRRGPLRTMVLGVVNFDNWYSGRCKPGGNQSQLELHTEPVSYDEHFQASNTLIIWRHHRSLLEALFSRNVSRRPQMLIAH